MQERDFVEQFAELAARLKRIERWQDQWRTRNRKVAGLQADGVLATDGYLVAPGRGLCANRHEEYRPPRQTYPSGRTILRAIEPGAEYHSLLPLYWKLPVRKNRVESGILFTFNDGSTVSRQHSGRTSDLKETHPANLRFDKDGLTCVRAEFFAHNVGATSVRERLGFFTFEGWQS